MTWGGRPTVSIHITARMKYADVQADKCQGGYKVWMGGGGTGRSATDASRSERPLSNPASCGASDVYKAHLPEGYKPETATKFQCRC